MSSQAVEYGSAKDPISGKTYYFNIGTQSSLLRTPHSRCSSMCAALVCSPKFTIAARRTAPFPLLLFHCSSSLHFSFRNARDVLGEAGEESDPPRDVQRRIVIGSEEPKPVALECEREEPTALGDQSLWRPLFLKS